MSEQADKEWDRDRVEAVRWAIDNNQTAVIHRRTNPVPPQGLTLGEIWDQLRKIWPR